MDSYTVIIGKASENLATSGENTLHDGTSDLEDNCVQDSDVDCAGTVLDDIDSVSGSDSVSEECDATGEMRSKRNVREPKPYRHFHLY